MDISPLPHKQPCFIQITLPSPLPSPEDDDEDMVTPGRTTAPAPLPRLEMPVQAPAPRRPSLQRPSLLRSKMYSTNTVPIAVTSPKESLLPPFQFGGPFNSPASASTPNLLDAMRVDSPIDESPAAFQAFAGPRRPSIAPNGRANGSPMGGVAKKPVFAPSRPRKQVRRSLSMFQHPGDVMRDEEAFEPTLPTLSSISDVEPEHKPRLPHFKPDEPDSLPRIQQDTLINVISGEYNAHYDKIMVVDCRFEYEYDGGHIEQAVNYNDKERLAKDLFELKPPPKTLLIFHCEYSVHRAPRMAKFIRQHDRKVNSMNYPALTYPEMYILEGGYSQFFKQNRSMCFPQNYIEMEHKDHELACEKGMNKLKQRQKLSRAQTFAFGQSSPHVEDSPTSNIGGSRLGGGRSFSSRDVNDHSPMMARHFTRRLVTA